MQSPVPQVEIMLPEKFTGEEDLWRSVIVQVVKDFDLLADKVHRVAKTLGFAPILFRLELEEMIKETKTEWFEEICSFARTQPYRIHKILEHKYSAEHKIQSLKYRTKNECYKRAIALIKKDKPLAIKALRSLGLYSYYKVRVQEKSSPLFTD